MSFSETTMSGAAALKPEQLPASASNGDRRTTQSGQPQSSPVISTGEEAERSEEVRAFTERPLLAMAADPRELSHL